VGAAFHDSCDSTFDLPNNAGRQGVYSAEFIRNVQQHIRRPPPKLRDALLLAAAGDLTQDEIAAALKIPAATFRGRVRDARLRLKAQLIQRDLDRAIDAAAGAMMTREPSRALGYNVMARVREADAPAPRRFVWLMSAGSLVVCGALAIALTSGSGLRPATMTDHRPWTQDHGLSTAQCVMAYNSTSMPIA
jgi:Sigma-70, region 4